MNSVLEWSLEFDQMYNNITSNQAPGLTEHEKSIFLTRAQEALVKDYLSPKSNALGEGFDDSERRQSDFAYLIKVETKSEVTSSLPTKLDARSKVFEYPSDLLVVYNEQIQTGSGSTLKIWDVVPLSYAEYNRLMKKPYKYPLKGLAWRLQLIGSGENKRAEVVADFPGSGTFSYLVRGVERPAPIILPDVQGDTTTTTTELYVNGSHNVASCALPEHLHDEILQRAVILAKLAWTDAVAPQGQTQR